MTFAPSHLTAVMLFATSASIVFGITQRTTTRAMVRYGVLCWAAFVGVVIAASWLMYLVHK